MEQEFKALYKLADRLLQQDPKAQQVIVVRTSENIIYSFADHDIRSGNVKEVLQFEMQLKQNGSPRITELVCLWNDNIGWLDIPCWYLRKALVKMNPENKQTKVLLPDGDGFMIKTLEVMV